MAMAKVSRLLVLSLMAVMLVVSCWCSALDNLPTTTEESEGFDKEVKEKENSDGVIATVNKVKDKAYEAYHYGEEKASDMKDAAKEVGAAAKERARETASAAKQKLGSATEAAKQKAYQAREAARIIKEMGIDAMEDVNRKQSKMLKMDIHKEGSFDIGKQSEIGCLFLP